MHDVLVHYIEVNFAEIAEQLARASGREPGSKERSEAAERLRSLIRRLRRDAEASQWKNHEPRVTTSEMIAGVNGELRPEERRVLDHFFDLFARSMQRTQAASVPEPAAEEAAVEPAQPAQDQAPPAAVAPEPALTEPAAPAVAVLEPALAEAEAEAEADAEEPTTAEAEPTAEPPAAPSIEPPPTPMPAEIPAARLVPEQTAGPLQTILLAAAQQALDLLQVDASQVYTLGDQRRFVLRAGVPTESLAAPEGTAAINSRLLRQALDNNEVVTVEDLSSEELTPDEAAWVDVGFRGFAAIALSPPLERPVGVLALLRRTPWRLDRRDAVRLEDLAVEAVAALRAHSLAIKVAEVAVLQERLSLAREIHDGLASDLAAVVALFKYYEQRRQRDPDDASQLLPQLRSMSEEILAGARDILQSLRPKTIQSEGLLASVLKLVDQFGRVNLVETNVSIRGEESAISAEQKEVIFQVLRESLSNVRKHSQARNLWVVLDLSTVPWVLTVRDDGRGFDVRRVAEDPKKIGSYGLVGMRERAELLGGSLEIVSQSLEGTLVTLIGPPERSE
ncbi:MAG: GAF domain-containing sensor histidine kinase [Chloroflexi bacterium]|nr:MAG: GAF domain-containing sensor histidine kinase [Chloroflexota bacterium]